MKKRRGFTLSELLVVVVIIGVLSAVVLPKFSKVIETRKTTEAEELMSAVRTEQEARCTLSKKYTDQTSKLGSYKAGKNFDYSLGTVGMSASAKSGKYKLEMPSYADGRICCSEVREGGKECEKLNKNYPLCKDLVDITKTPDYVAGNANCEIETEATAEPEPPVIINACPANHPMAPTYTDEEGCTVTTNWELKEYPDCWISTKTKSNCPKTCDNSHSDGDIEQEDCACGKATYTWNCSSATNYEWKRTLTTACKDKPQDETKNCPQGTGTQTRSYTCQNGVWTAGEWTGECAECADDTYTYVAAINKCCLKNQPSSYNSSRDAQCWLPSFKWRYHKGIVHAGEALMDAYGSTPADPDATLSAMDFCMKRESAEFPQCNSSQKEGGVCYGNSDKCIYGGTKRITERYGVHYVVVECDSLECTYETEWKKLF